jgi:predicted Zn finger-like uncharacterized protein
MKFGEGLRKHGFRKWYERELLSSHAHMVLLLLCAIGLLGTFEVFSRSASRVDQLIDVAAVLLFAAVGVWSLRRYFYLLMHAEQVANQAVCGQCEAYGRFTLVSENSAANEATVQCKKCQHEWQISHTP